MHNIILLIIGLILAPLSVAIIYNFFGRLGLVIMLSLLTILANLQVLLQIDLFGITTTLGNIPYGATYLIVDIICENYGKKAARNSIMISIIMLIFFTLSMILAINFSVIQEVSTISNYNALNRIFGLIPRIIIASLIAYYISHVIDAFIYLFFKKLMKDKLIWFRNNFSTIFSVIIDTVIFTTLAFYGTLSSLHMIEISVSSFLSFLIVSVINTPVLYLAKWQYKKGLILD